MYYALHSGLSQQTETENGLKSGHLFTYFIHIFYSMEMYFIINDQKCWLKVNLKIECEKCFYIEKYDQEFGNWIKKSNIAWNVWLNAMITVINEALPNMSTQMASDLKTD